MCTRRALAYIMGAYSNIQNVINLKEKGIPQILIKNEAFGDKNILDEYLKCQIFNNVNEQNIKDELEKMVEFISDIFMSISLNR